VAAACGPRQVEVSTPADLVTTDAELGLRLRICAQPNRQVRQAECTACEAATWPVCRKLDIVACSAFWELLGFDRTVEQIGRIGRVSSVFIDEVLPSPAKKCGDGLRDRSCVARMCGSPAEQEVGPRGSRLATCIQCHQMSQRALRS